MMKSSPPLVMGLFSVKKKEKRLVTPKMMKEVARSLEVNPWYRKKVLFLAGDFLSARILEGLGLHVYRNFQEASSEIHDRSAFLMKHWMMLSMLREFGEALWIDWDTINLLPLDQPFFEFCRAYQTPKFVYIPGYHATVNCSVYYVSHHWLKAMEKSFQMNSDFSNDEELWRAVLPSGVIHKPEFWWGDRVVNVWLKNECAWVKPLTYFAHVKTFAYGSQIRKHRRSFLSDCESK